MLIRGFELVRLLGRGSYGTVYFARHSGNDKTCALKVIDVRDMDAKHRDNTMNEIRLLASIKHPNILQYMTSFVENGHLYIATEYVNKGDLEGELNMRKMASSYLEEDVIWKYFVQITTALKVLHGQLILHRDLKSANILITSEGYIKLADFGVARILKSNSDLAKTRIGTPYYLSPEIWMDKTYNYKSDIWALGVLLYEMTCLKYPFEGDNMQELAKKVTAGVYPNIPRHYNHDLTKVISLLLCMDPNLRPPALEIMNNPIVAAKASIVSKELEYLVEPTISWVPKLVLSKSGTSTSLEIPASLEPAVGIVHHPSDNESHSASNSDHEEISLENVQRSMLHYSMLSENRTPLSTKYVDTCEIEYMGEPSASDVDSASNRNRSVSNPPQVSSVWNTTGLLRTSVESSALGSQGNPEPTNWIVRRKLHKSGFNSTSSASSTQSNMSSLRDSITSKKSSTSSTFVPQGESQEKPPVDAEEPTQARPFTPKVHRHSFSKAVSSDEAEVYPIDSRYPYNEHKATDVQPRLPPLNMSDKHIVASRLIHKTSGNQSSKSLSPVTRRSESMSSRKPSPLYMESSSRGRFPIPINSKGKSPLPDISPSPIRSPHRNNISTTTASDYQSPLSFKAAPKTRKQNQTGHNSDRNINTLLGTSPHDNSQTSVHQRRYQAYDS